MTNDEILDGLEYGANLCIDEDPEINAEAERLLELIDAARSQEPILTARLINEIRLRLDDLFKHVSRHE